MKNNNTIKIKNELPELLEAVCNHEDCPEWLTDAIWDAFNNQTMYCTYSADFWRAQFESIAPRPRTATAPNDALGKERNSNVIEFTEVKNEHAS
jgi:hypothetical protein